MENISRDGNCIKESYKLELKTTITKMKKITGVDVNWQKKNISEKVSQLRLSNVKERKNKDYPSKTKAKLWHSQINKDTTCCCRPAQKEILKKGTLGRNEKTWNNNSNPHE